MSNGEYIKIILELSQKLDENDNLFLKQIYTLFKKHLERKGRH